MSFLVPALLSLVLAQPSEAEKIVRLERSLDADRKQLEQLDRDLHEAGPEYQQAQSEFTAFDQQLAKKSQEVEQLRKQSKLAEAEALHRRFTPLRNQWRRARERFDLAIQKRKALQEKAASLQRTTKQEQAELARILAHTPAHAPDLFGQMFEQACPHNAKEARKEDRRKEDSQLGAAREQARKAADAAREAHARAETLSERIDALKQSVVVEEKLRDSARNKAELARKTRRALDRDLTRAPEAEKAGLRERIAAADQRHAEAGQEDRASTDRLADLQAELAALQADQLAALREAELRNRESAAADQQVISLEELLSPGKVLHWLKGHGPGMALIVLAMLVLRWLTRRASRHIARLVIRSTHSGRSDLEDRAETLANVFRGTTSLAILLGGVLMLLEHLGVPVLPLLGGAAVLGLAVAFGAQNLVKDYFTGFMVLMEDQYAVNDIIKVNGSSGGKVEKITLRMTVLRDSSGTAHFIPHGSITTVSNMSHGWSRASFEVGIAYKEDTDRVMQVLAELCVELREDEIFGPMLLEDAELLGVDALADSAVMLKFVVKTKAQEQWKVKRELLRRIKYRFDQLGIEIPFPTRTLYHREVA